VAWIPGVSPSVASIAARFGAQASAEEFLVSIAGVNSANALFSLVALYVIDKPRSGAAAAIQQLLILDQCIVVQMIMMIIIVAAASYLACIGAARLAARTLFRLNYRWLCLIVLTFLVAMTFAFTGFFGLFIFFISTVVGLIAPVAGIHKTHAYGSAYAAADCEIHLANSVKYQYFRYVTHHSLFLIVHVCVIDANLCHKVHDFKSDKVLWRL